MFSTKKAEDPLKGLSAFIYRLGCHQVDTYTSKKMVYTTFRLCNPLLLDALYITVDLETRFLYEPSLFMGA